MKAVKLNPNPSLSAVAVNSTVSYRRVNSLLHNYGALPPEDAFVTPFALGFVVKRDNQIFQSVFIISLHDKTVFRA
jgi:hypothetical protein